MSQLIKPDGIALNGRRFNHPDMSDHIGMECTVELIDSNTVHLWLKDGTEIIATAQSAIAPENYEMQSDILMQQMKNILEDHGELRAEDLFKKALEMRGETGDARQLCIDTEIDPDCILRFKGINHAS